MCVLSPLRVFQGSLRYHTVRFAYKTHYILIKKETAEALGAEIERRNAIGDGRRRATAAIALLPKAFSAPFSVAFDFYG